MKQVQVAGRLAQDPELKTVGGGTSLVELDLAVDDYDYKAKEKRTAWIPITIWAQQAEYVAKYGTKGDGLVVNGELCIDQYESNKFHDDDGNPAKIKKFFVKAAMGGVSLYKKGERSQDGAATPLQEKLVGGNEDDIPF